MMRQSFEHACKGPVGKALQGKKVGHGSSAFQEGQSTAAVSGAPNVRHGSSTSGWDVGNPPTDEKNPGDVKGEQGENKGPSSGRQEHAKTPSLQKETSTRQYFHDKAREVEERLSQEKKKAEEAEASKE
ncbi:hypothetical protein GOP47_0023450 [Adiantum capillus-veneris]|uniref:Uncharacterized protein n=2 Tax=Adiantum capillus-veneris TaxID=13818 RepID=A0A9D4U4I1_ADICA|nr:hypothetical protein GOP47_0023450 [Adiantum capillus-veneris]